MSCSKCLKCADPHNWGKTDTVANSPKVLIRTSEENGQPEFLRRDLASYARGALHEPPGKSPGGPAASSWPATARPRSRRNRRKVEHGGMGDAQFYAVAAQVIPTFFVALAVEMRALGITAPPSPFAVALSLLPTIVGEFVALIALRNGLDAGWIGPFLLVILGVQFGQMFMLAVLAVSQERRQQPHEQPQPPGGRSPGLWEWLLAAILLRSVRRR